MLIFMKLNSSTLSNYILCINRATPDDCYYPHPTIHLCLTGPVFQEGGGRPQTPEGPHQGPHVCQSQGSHAVPGTPRGRSCDTHMMQRWVLFSLPKANQRRQSISESKSLFLSFSSVYYKIWVEEENIFTWFHKFSQNTADTKMYCMTSWTLCMCTYCRETTSCWRLRNGTSFLCSVWTSRLSWSTSTWPSSPRSSTTWWRPRSRDTPWYMNCVFLELGNSNRPIWLVHAGALIHVESAFPDSIELDCISSLIEQVSHVTWHEFWSSMA